MVSWIKGHRSRFFRSTGAPAWDPPSGNRALRYKHRVSWDTNSSQLRNKAETTHQHNPGSQRDRPSVSQTDQARTPRSPDGPAWPQRGLLAGERSPDLPGAHREDLAVSGDVSGEERDNQGEQQHLSERHCSRTPPSCCPKIVSSPVMANVTGQRTGQRHGWTGVSAQASVAQHSAIWNGDTLLQKAVMGLVSIP